MPDTLRNNVRLNSARAHFTTCALGIKTRASYASGVKALNTFCIMHNMPSIYVQSWMPGEEIFIYFVTHCAASLSLAYATIRTYLAGIRNFFIEQGQGNPFLLCNGLPMLQLELVLKGIKKQHKPQQNKRLPITSTILCNLHLVLDGKLFSAYKDILMKAACSVAYFGFLRCGEFTTYGKVFNFDSNLCLGDISFTMSNKQPVAMHLFLKASKTDPFRQGCTIRYFRLSNVICPVQNLYRFLQIRLSISCDARSPLFMLPDGAPLSRGLFLNMLSTACRQAGIRPDGFTGHSFRIGAATVCARQNIPDHLIQTMGRWRSSCYQAYIRVSNERISHAQQHMAESIPSNTI